MHHKFYLRTNGKESAIFIKLMFVIIRSLKRAFYCVQFGEEGYYPAGYYDSQQAQYEKIKTALTKLEHGMFVFKSSVAIKLIKVITIHTISSTISYYFIELQEK